jgi:ABC-type transport system substrate-binding protein
LNNAPFPTLSGDWLPKGTFEIALFGNAPGTTDPGIGCRSFCSNNIPTEANGYQGGNVARVSSSAIDAAWTPVNTELDDARRLQLVRQAQQTLADEVPTLPIAPVLDVVIYNTVKIGGPVKASPGAGAFANLNEWYCRTC